MRRRWCSIVYGEGRSIWEELLSVHSRVLNCVFIWKNEDDDYDEVCDDDDDDEDVGDEKKYKRRIWREQLLWWWYSSGLVCTFIHSYTNSSPHTYNLCTLYICYNTTYIMCGPTYSILIILPCTLLDKLSEVKSTKGVLLSSYLILRVKE